MKSIAPAAVNKRVIGSVGGGGGLQMRAHRELNNNEKQS